MNINATSLFQMLVIGVLPLLWFILPLTSAYLASNRGQSKALWFFLTLVFPFGVLFIAMKDKTS